MQTLKFSTTTNFDLEGRMFRLLAWSERYRRMGFFQRERHRRKLSLYVQKGVDEMSIEG